MNFVWQTATNGDWWDAVDWDAGGGFPYGVNDTVDLSVAGAAFTVTMHDGTISTTNGGSETITGYAIGYLKVGANATLLAQTSVLDLAAGAANSGTIIADYSLVIGYTTPNAAYSITSLTGAMGHIVLNGATGATLSGNTTGIELDLHGNSLEGSGSVSNIKLKIYDDARISANVSGQTLVINTGADVLNNGVIGATNGGTLNITGSNIRQAPYASGNLTGAINASDKSTVVLSSDHIYGGVISQSGSGLVTVGDYSNIFEGASNNVVNFTNGFEVGGYSITLKGVISNTGVMSVVGGTILIDASGVQLSSGGAATKGQINLVGGVIESSSGSGANAYLKNVDNQIHGYGSLYYLNLQNQAAGVVNADVSGQTLSLDASDMLTNMGTLEATNGGTLSLSTQTLDAALGGTVFAGANSTVALSSVTFQGGTLAVGTGGKFLISDYSNVLDGSTASGAVTLAQSLNVGGYNLAVKGTLHNKGTLAMPGGTLEIDAAGVTLDSGGAATKGVISLAGGVFNSTTNAAQGSALDNIDNQIVGHGYLYNLKFTNETGGVVDANVSQQAFSIDSSDKLTNKGLLEATNGGTLSLSTQTLDAALGGTVFAGANSTVALSSVTFQGGTLAVGTGGKFLISDYSNVLDGSTASGAVTLAQSLNVGGYNLAVKGTLHNKGTLAMPGGTLEIDAAGVTLDSGGAATKGVISLAGGVFNSTTNAAQGSALDNIDNQIVGHGYLYNLKFTNETGGVVDANVSQQALSIDSSDKLTNKGLLEATNGGTLSLSTQTLDAALGGTVFAGANSTVAISSVTFQGGTLAVGTGGKFLISDYSNVLDGSTASGAVTLAQSLNVGGYNLTVKGTLHNKGKLALPGGTLEIDAAGATLDSGGAAAKGVISLAGGVVNSTTNAAQGSALDNINNQIAGYGYLYNLKLTNEVGGVLNANVAQQALSIDGSDSVTNKGILEASASGTLNLSGGYFFNAGGVIWANGGALNLSSMVVRQGTLTTTGASKIVIADSNVTFDNGNVTDGLKLAGNIVVTDGNSLAIAGSVIDNGRIYLGDANGASSLYLGATLDGIGSIVMSNNQANVISGGFNNVRSTIVGGGTITAVIQQATNGVIEATSALTLTTGATIANGGLMEAIGGVLTVNDAVSGFGTALVAGSGALSFASTFNENVTFRGTGRLAISQTYTGLLSGFTLTDKLDLTNIAYSAGEHMVFRGAASGAQVYAIENAANAVLETFRFKGEYSQSFFSIANNGGSAEITVNHLPLSPVATNSFNGDVTSDILWTNIGNNTIQTWTMLHGAEFASHNGPALSAGNALAGTGDFSGDGSTDLLFYNATSGAVQEWDMVNGLYSKSHALGSEAPSTGWGVAGTGDFNGDGNADILWVNSSTHQAMVWEERNNAQVGTTTMAGPGAGWNVIGTGDFNADGTTDVLWENASTKSVLDWQMSNGSLKSSSNLGTVASGSSFVGVGDFDGKGADEVLFQTSTGALSAWQIVNGANVGTLSLASGVPAGFAVARVGDFNGDGVSDVSLYNSSTGAVDVGLVSGGTIASWASAGTQTAGQWHLAA